MTIKVKKPLLSESIANNKSVDAKLQEMNPVEPIAQEGELISRVDTSPLEVQQVMRKYRLKKETRGIRVNLDEDLHSELKILCIRLGKTQEDFLTDLIANAVRKESKKFEK